MRYYFAPMEGITDSIYRHVHHRYFPGLDRYYMPFLSPTQHRTLTPREQRELPMADSEPFCAVPQILTRDADAFLWAARLCHDRGYDEVNLNMGCPSGTVVSKGKGAGMLRELGELAQFLDDIYAHSPLPVSIKTRLGLEKAEEFPAIVQLLNDYPVRELIIHPRVRRAFYGGLVELDSFEWAVQNCSMPLCYNGDLTDKSGIAALCSRFPDVEAVMLGRGLLGDPGMLTIRGTDAATLEAFTTELLDSYIAAFGSARNAMFRMKENWRFLLRHFRGSEKLGKQLRKTTDIAEFTAITREIIHTLPMEKTLLADWVEQRPSPAPFIGQESPYCSH